MAIELIDDGTLDTVLQCSECGEEFRFSFDPGPDEPDGEAAYDADLCESCWREQHEPQDGDITTKDHRTFYQYGKIVLVTKDDPNSPMHFDYRMQTASGRFQTLGTFDTVEAAIRAYMDRTQFFPAAWWVSDHGNAHLIDLSGGK